MCTYFKLSSARPARDSQTIKIIKSTLSRIVISSTFKCNVSCDRPHTDDSTDSTQAHTCWKQNQYHTHNLKHFYGVEFERGCHLFVVEYHSLFNIVGSSILDLHGVYYDKTCPNKQKNIIFIHEMKQIRSKNQTLAELQHEYLCIQFNQSPEIKQHLFCVIQ